MKDDTITQEIAAMIREMRQLRGLSLHDVADACSVDATQISRIEKGITKKISVELFLRAADLFKINVTDFIDRQPSRAKADIQDTMFIAWYQSQSKKTRALIRNVATSTILVARG